MEGPDCFGSGSCDQTGLELPVAWYDHGRGCSITGGFVYRGDIEALQGRYLFTDLVRGWVLSTQADEMVRNAGDPDDLATIEEHGGGSARCMLAEVFGPA